MKRYQIKDYYGDLLLFVDTEFNYSRQLEDPLRKKCLSFLTLIGPTEVRRFLLPQNISNPCKFYLTHSSINKQINRYIRYRITFITLTR